MKIALNRNHGGFGLSHMAYKRLIELGMKTCDGDGHDDEICIHVLSELKHPGDKKYYAFWDEDYRTNPLLIQVIEELGSILASGDCGKVKVIEIPDGVKFVIREFDGYEQVHECHRCW